jgi:hypothetical protein
MSDQEKSDIIAKDEMAQAGPGHKWGWGTEDSARALNLLKPAPGAAPAPGPLKVPADKLRSSLGVREVNYVQGLERLAIVDKPLSA